MITAHIFLVDHLLSTVWTTLLAIDWWVYDLHDGQRPALSKVQQDIIDVGPGKPPVLTPEELKVAAQQVWNQEKGSAAMIIIVGWLIKVRVISLPTTNSWMLKRFLRLFSVLLRCCDIFLRHPHPKRHLPRLTAHSRRRAFTSQQLRCSIQSFIRERAGRTAGPRSGRDVGRSNAVGFAWGHRL